MVPVRKSSHAQSEGGGRPRGCALPAAAERRPDTYRAALPAATQSPLLLPAPPDNLSRWEMFYRSIRKYFFTLQSEQRWLQEGDLLGFVLLLVLFVNAHQRICFY